MTDAMSPIFTLVPGLYRSVIAKSDHKKLTGKLTNVVSVGKSVGPEAGLVHIGVCWQSMVGDLVHFTVSPLYNPDFVDPDPHRPLHS